MSRLTSAEASSWTAGFTRHHVEIAGGDVSWLQGTEPIDTSAVPIVMVHGSQGSAIAYCELGRRLRERGPTYLLDLRGHGHSSAAPDRPDGGSIADQVEVVVAFLREVVGPPVVLVGNSFGAIVCAHVARHAPDTVSRLVLIGPAVRPSAAPVHLPRLLQGLVIRPRWLRDSADDKVRSGKVSEAPDARIKDSTPYLDLVPPAYLETMREQPAPAWHVDDPDGRAALWRGRRDALGVLSRPRQWRDLLRSISQPALWLHGADDPKMPEATADQIRRQLPQWTVETVSRTGHVPQVERPEWTANRILTWLWRNGS